MDGKEILQQWEGNPSGLAFFLGSILAKTPSFTDHCSCGFGEQLFSDLRICDRIDFLFDNKRHRKRTRTFNKTVQFGIKNDIPYIEDVRGDFGYISIMFLRDLDPLNSIYAIRLFANSAGCSPSLLPNWTDVEPNFENVAGRHQVIKHEGMWQATTDDSYEHVSDHDETFWNFVRNGEHVKIWESSDGFKDITTTRRIAKITEWTTNMLGFCDA